MFNVNGNPLLVDEMQVLEEVRTQALANGKDIMRGFKYTGTDNIMTTCPFHKDGQERKPSFGISVVNMSCHCFTCGWSGSLDMVISEIFGYEDGGHFGRTWLSKNFLSVSIEDRAPIQLNLDRGAKNKPRRGTEGFTERELDSFRYYHPYMFKRGLDDEIIEKFDVGYDADTDSITLPVYNVDNTPAFIARRSVSAKFFHYPQCAKKPVYAAERLTSGLFPEVIICESVFNALTCWKHGRAAVALLGTGDNYQYEVLRNLPVRKYVLALDPDKAGERGAKKLHDELSSTKVLTYLALPPGKDVNDCDDIFDTLKEYF